MKKLLLFAISSLAAQISFGQYNSAWNYTTLNYNVGIGTKTTNANNNSPTPAFNLQLHGTADYSIIQDFPNPPLNVGKTTRLGFTNTITGMSSSDGVEFRMSENNFSIENRESGNVRIAVPTVNMTFSNQSSRIWVGTVSDILSINNARMNVIAPTSENGFYIQGPSTSGKYGLSVRMIDNTSDAIQVNGTLNWLGNLLPIKNFSVKGNGEVNTKDLFVNGKLRVTDGTTNNVFSVDNTGLIRSREILVDDLPIPDYVFKPDYKLMTLKEVEEYVSKFHHLPNVKSELEFQEAGGVQLGEMNLKLLEKVEELTLYVIDLQKQIDELKNK
jgi:hypothetical protein